jgi:phosphoribosylaminoimidazole-succinocarboxamide synthase
VRNIASGSFCKKFGTKNGFKFKSPCVEFSYKDDSLGDPAISEGQILALEIINQGQIDLIKNIALEVNKILKDEFAKMELNLVDFKIEFGFDKNDNKNGEIILADEITPDSCRLWNVDGKSFDKDVFRKDLGDVMIGYEYILGKLEV